MRRWLAVALAFALILAVCSCEKDHHDNEGAAPGAPLSPPTVPTGGPRLCIKTLIPAPCDPAYDEQLENLARLYDRQFHVFNAYTMGMNADVEVDLGATEVRQQIQDFLWKSDGWNVEEYSGGKSPLEMINGWEGVAGLYGGVGIAADAYRYGVLRDQHYDPAEVDIARRHLIAALEGLHLAVDITGVPGVIARGVMRTDIPGGAGIVTTPLFDQQGNPLPTVKNNGTTRADNSGGRYPNYVWTDSCSRDQHIGWAAAFAAAWEVIQNDPTFSDELKFYLKKDARELGQALMVVRDSGFDLEIPDADGRTTYHGYINENNFDRIYIPFLPIKNGMYSLMALGALAAFQYVAQDDKLQYFIYDVLIKQRHLDEIAKSNQIGVDLGTGTNYSSVNMAFQGAVLAIRYIPDETIKANLRVALQDRLYAKPHRNRQPIEQGQSLFDFVYAGGMAGSTAWQHMFMEPDPGAVARGLETLRSFPTPPFWEVPTVNCDADEIAAHFCKGIDGTPINLLGYLGRGGTLIAAKPIPMRIRPASNYFWRSNPYEPNGGGTGGRLLGAPDFRYVYWLGRWSK